MGVNTALDQINITSHGYKSGEILKYTTSSSSIGGISDGSTYYVSVVDEDNCTEAAKILGDDIVGFGIAEAKYQGRTVKLNKPL